MGVRNVVLMFILVWTFTAADDDFSVSCDEVTGTVRKEVTLTCSLSSKKSGFCITFYKFHYLQKYTDFTICREEFPQDCEQRNIFRCSFSPTTVMTGQFKFFVQIMSGWKYTEFTVNITEPSEPEPVTEAPDINAQRDILTTVASPGTENGFGSKNAVIAAVTGCFIFIIFIIIMTIIYKKKPNYSQSCGFQRRMILCHKHDDNNSNFQEQNPEDVL